MTSECKEEDIQNAVNEYLCWQKIRYFRIPDSFFKWIYINAPKPIQKWFFGMFGGMPDNLCIIPIGKGVAMTLLLELKSPKGKLHGKQKDHKNEWIICKNIDSAIEVIDRFKAEANHIKKHCTFL